MTTDLLADWDVSPFAYDGITHDVYRSGDGPGVILIPELPGATPEVIALGERLVAVVHAHIPLLHKEKQTELARGVVAQGFADRDEVLERLGHLQTLRESK